MGERPVPRRDRAHSSRVERQAQTVADERLVHGGMPVGDRQRGRVVEHLADCEVLEGPSLTTALASILLRRTAPPGPRLGMRPCGWLTPRWPRGMRSRRSCLSVPGSSAKMLAKARSLPADEVVLDLEDAVAADAKEAVRSRRRAAIARTGPGGPRRSRQCNGHRVVRARRDRARRGRRRRARQPGDPEGRGRCRRGGRRAAARGIGGRGRPRPARSVCRR